MWASANWQGLQIASEHRYLVHHRVRYNDVLLRTAGALVDWLGSYNALHVRRGDWTAVKHFGKSASLSHIRRRAARALPRAATRAEGAAATCMVPSP